MLPTTDPQYWEQRYQEDTAKWDIGMAAPPFASLLASTKAPIAGKTAVIGCGQGHDAILFAKHGFDTIGFDFAPSAIALGQKLSQTMEISMQFLQRDIFELPQEFPTSFDYAIEHTCFCAIRPEQRSDYVKMVRSILNPTGELIALFWAHNRPDGPPFGTKLEEIQDLFSASFDTS
ncbi:MAG: methyltransferase domain-containing protein, partial [Pseudanabaena sp.]